MFSDFFSSVFESLLYPIDDTPFVEGTCSNNFLIGISLSEAIVEEALKTLDPNKGPGPDEIPRVF